MTKLIIIWFITYSLFFTYLGNTIFRFNSSGIKKFSIKPLFTEGFVGPIRTFFLILFNGSFLLSLKYIYFEFFRLSNPYSAMFFIFYINKIIKNNIIKSV